MATPNRPPATFAPQSYADETRAAWHDCSSSMLTDRAATSNTPSAGRPTSLRHPATDARVVANTHSSPSGT